MKKNVVERRKRCLTVMSRPSPVASPHASNDKGDDIGRKAVVDVCAHGGRAANDHDGIASFLVELGNSANNSHAVTMDEWLLGENDKEQGSNDDGNEGNGDYSTCMM